MKLDLPTLNKKRVNKRLFLDKNFCIGDVSIDIDASYSIVLSPSLYWVKKEYIPVKYPFQAYRLLPLLFEDILPQGEYNYTLNRIDGNEYMIFAYNQKKIENLLRQYNIDITRVTIHFAQNEFGQYEKIAINENTYLNKINDIVVVVPTSCEDCIQITDVINEITLSSNKVNISSISAKLTYQTSIKLSIVFILASVGFFIQAYFYSGYAQTIESQKAELIQKWDIPTTSIQQNSIIKKFKKTNKTQLQIRTVLSKLSQYIREKNSILLQNLEINKGKIFVQLSYKGDNQNSEIQRLQKEFKGYHVVPNQGNIEIRGDYEY